MPDKSPDAEDMDLVIRETKRCAAIIKRLLDFAREKPPEKKFTDLNQIIEDTVRLVERPAHLRDIEITVRSRPDLPPIWIDADQIKQVIMNMLVNAQHAVEEKGSITVRTRRSSDLGARRPASPCRWRRYRSSTPAAAFRKKTCSGSSIRSSPRRTWAREPDWACPSVTESSRPMAA